MKKVTVLGPAHPYRGGLASIMEIMARTFAARGAEVDIKTFTLQYPEFLFPGKTQYSDRPAPEDLNIERCVSTVNPFNWIKVGRRIRRERPDVVLLLVAEWLGRRRQSRLYRVLNSEVLIWSYFALVVAWWVARNIFGW